MLMNSSHRLGFRRNDSTETLMLRLLSDFYSTLAHGRVTLLALLDVSSAFDSVDHPVLIHVVPSHLSWLGVGTSLYNDLSTLCQTSLAVGYLVHLDLLGSLPTAYICDVLHWFP